MSSIVVDDGGKKWLALLDGSLNNTLDDSRFANLAPIGAAGRTREMWPPMALRSGWRVSVAVFAALIVACGWPPIAQPPAGGVSI